MKIDSNNNVFYKVFQFGKEYKIQNKSTQDKLRQMDEYRYFFCAYKPPIMIPILLFAFIAAVVSSFVYTEDKDMINKAFFTTGFVLYLLNCALFYGRIYYLIAKDR